MLYPDNIEQKLGFDSLRQWLKGLCLGSAGQDYVDKMRFGSEPTHLQKILRQTDEYLRLLLEGRKLWSGHYVELQPLLNKIKPQGSFLEAEECKDLNNTLAAISGCITILNSLDDSYSHLKALSITLDPGLCKLLDQTIDAEGKVKPDASPELRILRKRISEQQQQLRKETDRLMRQYAKDKMTDEDLGATFRNGRVVIPIRSEYKRKIKGLVHDVSSSGQTTYLEPVELVDINNEIRELEIEEKQEIIRILIRLCDTLRLHQESLSRAGVFAGLIDFIRAKALLAQEMKACLPQPSLEAEVKLVDARHPLLEHSLHKQGKAIVPISLELNSRQRILIISGPNAGGKSISLKTAGLLQYMYQCGLLIPASESSRLGLFQSIFIDIGDEQSLENDLSTYSSHLINMKHFIRHADNQTLVLADEIGTGTEPKAGSVMAEAVLEKLKEKECLGIFTTHYSNLKALADKYTVFINGAMRFDQTQLLPLFQLETGKPGKSFAFELAYKIGMNHEVIQNAKSKLDDTELELDRMLSQLEKEKIKYEKLRQEAQVQKKQLDETLDKYTALTQDLERKEKEYLKAAKEKAALMLSETNKMIENTIRSIKENKAEKESTQQLRKELDQYKQHLLSPLSMESEEEITENSSEPSPEPGPIEPGVYVRVKGSQTYGEVVQVFDKDAEVIFGQLKSKIKLNKLERVTRKEYRQNSILPLTTTKKPLININEKQQLFYPTLDLRGMRGEEALVRVNELIDNALLFGAQELKLVHGKGDGILRNLIRQHLSGNPYIASMADEHADRGGAGVTVVTMK